MIDSFRREAESYVDVELLQGRNFIGGADVKQVARATALGEIPGVFDEGVHRFGELAIQQEGRFAGQVASRGLRGPVEGELSAGGPIIGELARPRQLQPRVVAVARLRFRASGKAQEDDERYVESGGGAELLFHPNRDVSEAALVIIVGGGEAQFGGGGQAEGRRGLRAVKGVTVGAQESILHLETALRNDGAGGGYGRTIGRDRLIARGRILAGKKHRSQHRDPDGEVHMSFSSSARRVRIGFNSSSASFSAQPSTMRFPS